MLSPGPPMLREYVISWDVINMLNTEGACGPPPSPSQAQRIIMCSDVMFLITYCNCRGLYLLIQRPEDFGTHFLAIMISNFLSSLVYYAIAKVGI